MRREWQLLLLGLAVLATALGVVYVRHEARRAFVELQALKAERDQLITDWGRLQLEYATWADGSRIEAVARRKLDLREPGGSRVMVVFE